MKVSTTSSQFTLNLKDVLKGLLVAVLTPVITIIIDSISSGGLTFNWTLIGVTALTAGLSYIVKNFLSPGTVVIEQPTDRVFEAAKTGDVKVDVPLSSKSRS